ncbi:unnamed protein product [Rotaria socialis]
MSIVLVIFIILGQIFASLQCQPSTCNTSVAPCSTNSDCECLALTLGSGGICAVALLSCSSLTPCSSDNVTCTVPCTVCVVSTRCNKPMCYPQALAVAQVCPPLNSNATTQTTSTSTGFANEIKPIISIKTFNTILCLIRTPTKTQLSIDEGDISAREENLIGIFPWHQATVPLLVRARAPRQVRPQPRARAPRQVRPQPRARAPRQVRSQPRAQAQAPG